MYDLCYRPQTKTLIEVESVQMYACSHHGLPSCICYGTFLIAHYIPLPMAFIASNTIISCLRSFYTDCPELLYYWKKSSCYDVYLKASILRIYFMALYM